MRIENTTEHPITISGHREDKDGRRTNDGKTITVPPATGAGRKVNGGLDKIDSAWLQGLRDTDDVVKGWFKDGDLITKDQDGPSPVTAVADTREGQLEEENAALKAKLAAAMEAASHGTPSNSSERSTKLK